MQLENTFVVPVPVEQAWTALLDVPRIAPCMPGATLDTVEGDEMTGRVKVKLGPIMVTYKGTVRFLERDEAAHHAVLEAAGKEMRGAGTAKATVNAQLTGKGDQTEVKVTTDLAVTGKPAQFGRGVMADVSGKLIDQFAACLAEELQGGRAAGQAGEAATGGADAAAAAGAGPAAVDGAVSTATAPAPAAAPLPPSGAPVEAAPSPAPPLPAASAAVGEPVASAFGVGSRGTDGSAATAPRRSAEAIDLLGTAGAPIAKRVAPVAAGVAALALLVWLLRRKK